MLTKKAEYTQGTAGANALIEDITEMFEWDAVDDSTSGVTFFKKYYEGEKYVSLVVRTITNGRPRVSCATYNGVLVYETSHALSDLRYAALICGNGFFAMCGSRESLPTSDNQTMFAGISTCTNLLTGDTGYCAFTGNNTQLHCVSKDSQATNYSTIPVTSLASAGAAFSIHEPATANVSDKVLILTAIPDTIYACMEKVSFNGIPYTRLGRILVPIE